MTNEQIALVALLADNALPVGTGVENIELNYGETPDGKAAYRRAVDTLDRLALLEPANVVKRHLGSGVYERVQVGTVTLLSPVGVLAAHDSIAPVEPVERLAGLRLVEAPRRLTPLPALAVLSDRDPGDEHDGPDAA